MFDGPISFKIFEYMQVNLVQITIKTQYDTSSMINPQKICGIIFMK